MEVIKYPLGYYVNKMRALEPFTFTRFGDGEWLTILGFVGRRNSNGCTFTKPLCDDLRAVVDRQLPYDHGVLRIALTDKRFKDLDDKTWHEFNGRERIDQYLASHNIVMPWVNGDVILAQSLKGNLFPLVEQIRERRVLYVSGNVNLRKLNMRNAGFFPYVSFIETPARNVHTVKDNVLRTVIRAVRKHKIDFIGWSSGLAAKVLIDQVFQEFPGITQIDFGSTFDGYFKPLPHVRDGGSRSYIRKGGYKWEALREQNTKGK